MRIHFSFGVRIRCNEIASFEPLLFTHPTRAENRNYSYFRWSDVDPLAHLFASPVVVVFDSTGFDSGEPSWRKKMVNTT